MQTPHDFGYPYSPAKGKTDTSEQAANALINPESLRGEALSMLRLFKTGLTADEIAHLMGKSGLEILSIRPRVTELVKQDLIEDTGRRRQNSSGRNAIVWRVKK
ncbi:MAG: hypothetical protein ABGY96_27365 [bacterium]